MDKTGKTCLPQYTRDNAMLTIESRFVGTDSIKELIKRYLLERREHEIYLNAVNKPDNMAAVTSAEEDKA